MKKDCAYTRKSLRKYIRGHLFKYEQVRIARHLNTCPVCRSEFQALKKVADTKQLLKDITPPEGLAGRMRAGVFGLAKLKLLLYRPFWLATMIAFGVLVYISAIAPDRDIEIENIEKSIPAVSVASAPTVTPVSAPAAVKTASVQRASMQPADSNRSAAASAVGPLVITITPENEKAAIQHINEIMQGHGQLTTAFSDSVRKISGTLTAKELLTFFNRIESAGKVKYSRKQLESFPTAQTIPFVMKIKPARRNTERPSSPTPPVNSQPAAVTATDMPASAPTGSAR